MDMSDYNALDIPWHKDPVAAKAIAEIGYVPVGAVMAKESVMDKREVTADHYEKLANYFLVSMRSCVRDMEDTINHLSAEQPRSLDAKERAKRLRQIKTEMAKLAARVRSMASKIGPQADAISPRKNAGQTCDRQLRLPNT